MLGNSPGSVHYHIKKLNYGGLIEIVKTKEVGGIIEKYYKAKSKWFSANSTDIIDSALNEDFNSTDSSNLSPRLFLKEEEKEELIEDVKILLEKWLNQSNPSELNKI
nr:hypothetical protein [Sutcliffiella horikoshii]